MTRTLPLALLALAAAAPAGAAERLYSVTDFDRVQVDGPYQVTLTTGRASGARAEGSAEALERVSIEVQGSTLRVRANRSAWGGYPGERAGPVSDRARPPATFAPPPWSGSGSLDDRPGRGACESTSPSPAAAGWRWRRWTPTISSSACSAAAGSLSPAGPSSSRPRSRAAATSPPPSLRVDDAADHRRHRRRASPSRVARTAKLKATGLRRRRDHRRSELHDRGRAAPAT